MLKNASIAGVIALVALFLLLVVACGSEPTPNPIEAAVYDGEHEHLSTVAKLAGVDLNESVLERNYRVSFSLDFTKTVEEILEFAQVENKEDLPGFIKVSEDGMASIPSYRFPFGFRPYEHLGFLGAEHVLTTNVNLYQACFWLGTLGDDSVFDEFRAVYKVQDGPIFGEVEALEEVLFNGTARELCNKDNTSFDTIPGTDMLLLKRPEEKRLPVIFWTQIVVANTENLIENHLLYLPDNNIFDGVSLDVALFKGLQDIYLPDGHTVLFSRNFKEATLGGAMYYIRGDRDNVLILVGFISAHGGAWSADFVLSAFSEAFPHTVEDAVTNEGMADETKEANTDNDTGADKSK